MKYSIKEKKENVAVANGIGLPLSLKDSVIISNFIRGKNIQKVKSYFEEVLSFKKALPYTKYNSDRGHKRGDMAAGRYPIKAIKYFTMLINSAEANALSKGLNANNLIISAIIPNKGNVGYHYGRRRGLKTKSVHIQLYLEESSSKDVKKEANKKDVKKTSKKEVKDDIKSEVKEVKSTSEKKEVKNKEKTENFKEEAENSSEDVKSEKEVKND